MSYRWTRIAYSAVVSLAVAMLMLLVACNGLPTNVATKTGVEATSSPVNSNNERAQAEPSRISAEANLSLSPDHGGAGRRVTVMGSGFPPNSQVEIRLGGLNTGATEVSYATLQGDESGAINGAFTMPERWPNGDRIAISQVMVIATTRDFMNKASAVFNYEADGTAPPASGSITSISGVK